MKYMGSKAKHADEILEAIMESFPMAFTTKENWIEPFVGGANMIDKIKANVTRYGNDSNGFVVAMFKALQNGWTPPDNLSEDDYQYFRKLSKFDPSGDMNLDALVGFAGIGCSYSGKWFGGYARGDSKNGNPRNYCLESKNNLMAQLENIKEVIFSSGDYRSMVIPPNSIVYCDPPYQGTTKYKDGFDHERFWKWCDKLVEQGQNVFVSEYAAPEGWNCIWEKKVNNSLTKDTGSKKGVERLFTK